MLNTNDGGTRLRSLASWAILAYVAIYLFFEFFYWVLPANKFDEFTHRSYFAGFLGVTTLGLIVLAVLLGAVMRPSAGNGRLVTMVALLELAVMLVLGALAWLIGFGYAFDGNDTARETMSALQYLVQTPVLLAITFLAAVWVMGAYTASGGRMPQMPSKPTAPSQPTE